MKKVLPLLFVLFPFLLSAQITKTGYAKLRWEQKIESIKNLNNCNSKLSGSEFVNCELQKTDSLFLGKYKFQFFNMRFYKGELCELQFDLKHEDISHIIAELSTEFGTPIIKEKQHKALDADNQSTGYIWVHGDTHILIINDGKRMPAICVLSSNTMKAKLPSNTLNLEKLIFE